MIVETFLSFLERNISYTGMINNINSIFKINLILNEPLSFVIYLLIIIMIISSILIIFKLLINFLQKLNKLF